MDREPGSPPSRSPTSVTVVGRQRLPRLRDRLRLGTMLSVSPVALGAVATPEVVLAAFDAGINFFFVTADMHWPIYEALRVGLAELLKRSPAVREQIVVAAVAYVTQPEFNVVPFEEVVAAVPSLDRLDVLVAGGCRVEDFFRRLPVYEQHRARGHCGARAIGASFHERAAARLATRHELLDISFIRYNASHPGARDDLFPALDPQAKTRIYNFTNTSGYVAPEQAATLGLPADCWQPELVDHYRFVLSRPEIDGLLCSLDTPAHVAELDEILHGEPLSPAEQDHLIALASVAHGHGTLA